MPELTNLSPVYHELLLSLTLSRSFSKPYICLAARLTPSGHGDTILPLPTTPYQTSLPLFSRLSYAFGDCDNYVVHTCLAARLTPSGHSATILPHPPPVIIVSDSSPYHRLYRSCHPLDQRLQLLLALRIPLSYFGSCIASCVSSNHRKIVQTYCLTESNAIKIVVPIFSLYDRLFGSCDFSTNPASDFTLVVARSYCSFPPHQHVSPVCSLTSTRLAGLLSLALSLINTVSGLAG